MQLTTKNYFETFVQWLASSDILTLTDIEDCLADLDGIKGVLEEEMFIMAYEMLARLIIKSHESDFLQTLLTKYDSQLTTDVEQQYFFVEALIDQAEPEIQLITDLVALAPQPYISFLKRRFGI